MNAQKLLVTEEVHHGKPYFYFERFDPEARVMDRFYYMNREATEWYIATFKQEFPSVPVEYRVR